MRRARMQAAGFGALLVSLLLAGAGVATAAGWLGSDTPPTRTRTVHITIHFSAFDPSDVEIQPGQTIRFVVENTDPIDRDLTGSRRVMGLGAGLMRLLHRLIARDPVRSRSRPARPSSRR